MDVGEVELCLPSVSEMNEQFVQLLKDYAMRKASDLLTQIASTENLPRDKLMAYLHKMDFDDIVTTISNAKRPRKKIESKDQCCAKTSKGDRCSRKRKEGTYCGSHLVSRPYGEVTDTEDSVPLERPKPCIKVK